MSIANEACKTSHPPLQPGDRLKSAEFERRYHAMPDCKKAELIEGIVYVPSPPRLRHGRPHARLITWVGNYVDATFGTGYADNGFVLQSLPEDGIYRSHAFPGLWLAADALLAEDGQAVTKTLGLGLESADHQQFVDRLKKRSRS